MTAPLKLLAFGGLLAITFAGAALAGSILEPIDEDPLADRDGHGDDESRSAAPAEPHGSGAADQETGSPEPASGLSVADGELRVEVEDSHLRRGEASSLRFRIVDEGGRAVREFDAEHERRMHLIVVRRDLAVYRHVHPRMAGGGTWEVDLTLPEAGAYRAFADFSTQGRAHTLATDLFVPGDFRPQELPDVSPVAGDAGYDVELDTGRIASGDAATIAYTVTRDGTPVADLEEYLGARGHLVALREGDLAFLHVHPLDDGHAHEGEVEPHADEGSERIAFRAEFPTPGRYRLFLQFAHEGAVRTVAHTVEVDR